MTDTSQPMRMLLLRLLPLLLLIFLGQAYAQTDSTNQGKKAKQKKELNSTLSQARGVQERGVQEKIVYGRYERVGIIELDAISFKAKMDTGALTSSLHAEEIEFFTKKNQKDTEEEEWVRFMTRFDGELVGPYEFPLARVSRVKVRHEEKPQQVKAQQTNQQDIPQKNQPKNQPKNQSKTDKPSKKKGSTLTTKRPVIELTLCIGDKKRAVEVNLTSRKNLLYPLLIGAKALRTFEGLVDVSEKFIHPLGCEVEFKR